MVRIVRILGLLIAAVGAINWGLIGVLDFNAVEYLFGGQARAIYLIIGIAGLYTLTVIESLERAHQLDPIKAQKARPAHQQ